MNGLRKFQCLDASVLKIIAMVFMIIDHIGAILYPHLIWLRVLGRISFPIFAYFVAEGYIRTKSPVRYMRRMAVFAIISEPVFDYTFFGRLTLEHQNVMVTFLIALMGLYVKDIIHKNYSNKLGENQKKIAECTVVLAFSLIAEYINTDYGCYGVIMVCIYQMLHSNFFNKHIMALVLQIFGGTGIQQYSAISAIPLMMYNGKRGIGMKYLFYAFYPIHLLVLYWCQIFLG